METTPKSLIGSVLPFLAAAALAAEPAFLVDEEGLRHGPFELRAKTELPLRGHVYRVEGLPDDAKALIALLKDTKLPPFQFNDARLPELARFVHENAAKQNPKLAGIAFLVADGLPEDKPQEPVPPTGERAAAPDATATAPVAATPVPPKASVSFQAEALSAWDFLTTTSALFGYRLDVDAKTVRVLSPRVPDGPLYRRTYTVLPRLQEGMTAVHDAPGDLSEVECNRDLKAILSEFGVGWPDGSSVQHYPAVGKLVAVNTLANHRVLRNVIRVLGNTPKQVEIDCQFVALPRAAVEKAARSGRVSSSTVLTLVREGQGTLLACPKVVTKNGSEATIKGVVEIIYPTEFTVGGSRAAATNELPSTGGKAVEPGGFETREIGVILQVVPDVTPAGNMINLTLAPQVVYPPEWQDYAAPAAGEKGSEATRLTPMVQPFFPVESITTSVQLYNGRTLVIGGGVPSKDGKTFTYILISATLVDPSGEEVDTDNDGGEFEPVDDPFGAK